jgi:hypothetical protein
MAFNEQAYLTANPDVAAAVQRGDFGSASDHYSMFGQYEGRDAGGATSGAQSHYWDSPSWLSLSGNGGGTAATGIKSSTTPFQSAPNLPGNASFYSAPGQFEGKNFNVGLDAVSWANVQRNIANGMNPNEAILRASGDGIGVAGIMPTDSGYLPYGIDTATGRPIMSMAEASGASAGSSGSGRSSGGGLIGSSMSGGGASAGANGSGFTPWQVTPQQTVQQQAYDVINRDSPLMQQARGRAMQAMNERGLINSSLGVQAGQDAVMDRALQLAAPDAATYARSGEFNAGQQNAWNLAQQELGMKGDQFSQELAFKREAMMMDADLKRELMDKETKYKSLLEGDAAFNKQYAMYVEALYSIDKDPNLSAEAKQAAKFQQARMLEDYAALRGMNLNLDFSSRFTPGSTDPAANTNQQSTQQPTQSHPWWMENGSASPL